MALQFSKIAIVAYMVPCSGLVHILVLHLLAGQVVYDVERFKNRTRVFPSSTNVVDRCFPWRLDEGLYEGCHVIGMHVVPYLFALTTIYTVILPLQVALHEMTQETMHFNTGVILPWQPP